MKPKVFARPGGAGFAGFTLLELLVTVSVIGVLAALILPALLSAERKAQQATCINNMHQLGLGFMLYHGDFNDAFPGCASKRTYGPQPEDWIWWQHNRDPRRSAIARYVAQFNPTLFRCPRDREARGSLQAKTGNPYGYSFSVTSYDLTRDREGKQVNLGMASIFTKDNPRKAFVFKYTDIRHPSRKLMLVEEDRKNLNDGRWIPNYPSFDLLTSRHAGKADTVFADGHAQSVMPGFGTNAVHSLPQL